MTVRFPSGPCVQYNSANHAEKWCDMVMLREKAGGRWIALVPQSCVIEIVTPCRVYHAPQQEESQVLKEVRAIKRRLPPRPRLTRARERKSR